MSFPPSLTPFTFGVAKDESRPLNAVARNLTFLGIPDVAEPRLRCFRTGYGIGGESHAR